MFNKERNSSKLTTKDMEVLNQEIQKLQVGKKK